MAILAAAILFITRASSDHTPYLILVFIIPVVSFWILDGYFLWQERLFRGIYNDVRLQDDTNFEMTIPAQLKKPGHKWGNATFSVTLNLFYLSEIFFIGVAFFTFRCG